MASAEKPFTSQAPSPHSPRLGLMSLLRRLVDLIIPPCCLICDSELRVQSEFLGMCSYCKALHDQSALNLRRCCLRCALPLDEQLAFGAPSQCETDSAASDGEATAIICAACQLTPPAFYRCRIVSIYEQVPALLTRMLKVNGKRLAAKIIAKEIAALIQSNSCLEGPSERQDRLVDALLPVPLHEAKLKIRGFNQAEEIATHLGEILKIEVIALAAKRAIETTSQQALSKEERRINLRGAFTIDPLSVAGKRLAIVDDVVTTTSTAREIALTAMKSGAVSCEIWAYTRTPERRDKEPAAHTND